MPQPTPTDGETGPKDVFFHLFSIVALYLSATYIGILAFQLINRALPDPVSDPMSVFYSTNLIRWALAMLVIVFPTYIWVTTAIERDLARTPEKRRLRTRRWLIYLTLFVAAVIIIGDLVRVVHGYLNGEITLRFILKVLIIFAIALVVFAYYRIVLTRDMVGTAPAWLRWFTRAVIGIVTVTVVIGFVIAGSPRAERLHQFDQIRVSHLQDIQWRIVEHWQNTKALPPSINALRDEISGYVPPDDPETRAPYEYRIVGEKQFELCATFRLEIASAQEIKGAPYATPLDGSVESWQHGVGRTCFTRTIDPTRYPPRDTKRID